MKYKVGDKVRIKSLDWYNQNKKKELRSCIECGNMMFTPRMSKWCGKIITIIRIENKCYMDENARYWTDEMIEGFVEEEKKISIKLTGKAIKNNEMDVSVDEYILPEGYILKDENGNVINATKIVLEKKKTKYPTTYEECCKVLDIEDRELVFNGEYRASKLYWKQLGRLNFLNKLLICRDAYWKIAGDEMGLGKSWEPQFENCSIPHYCLFINHTGEICKDCFYGSRCLLAFPTEEMRDAFYENFKELITECKELL